MAVHAQQENAPAPGEAGITIPWERIPDYLPSYKNMNYGPRMEMHTRADKMVEGDPQEVWIIGSVWGKPGKWNWDVTAQRYNYQIDEDCASGVRKTVEEAAAAAESFIADLKARWKEVIDHYDPEKHSDEAVYAGWESRLQDFVDARRGITPAGTGTTMERRYALRWARRGENELYDADEDHGVKYEAALEPDAAGWSAAVSVAASGLSPQEIVELAEPAWERQETAVMPVILKRRGMDSLSYAANATEDLIARWVGHNIKARNDRERPPHKPGVQEEIAGFLAKRGME